MTEKRGRRPAYDNAGEHVINGKGLNSGATKSQSNMLSLNLKNVKKKTEIGKMTFKEGCPKRKTLCRKKTYSMLEVGLARLGALLDISFLPPGLLGEECLRTPLGPLPCMLTSGMQLKKMPTGFRWLAFAKCLPALGGVSMETRVA